GRGYPSFDGAVRRVGGVRRRGDRRDRPRTRCGGRGAVARSGGGIGRRLPRLELAGRCGVRLSHRRSLGSARGAVRSSRRGEGLMASTALPITSGLPRGLRGVLPFLFAIPVLAALQLAVSERYFLVYIASIIGVNIILAVSLNIVNGMTGQFSIGHAGFMAVGAYISGKFSLETKQLAISFVPAAVSRQQMLIGGLV